MLWQTFLVFILSQNEFVMIWGKDINEKTTPGACGLGPCGSGQRFDQGTSTCLPCQDGTFMDEIHHNCRECVTCRFAEDRGLVVEMCTGRADVVVRCEPGYFYDSSGLADPVSQSPCRVCSRCARDQAVLRECRVYNDTVCTPGHAEQIDNINSGKISIYFGILLVSPMLVMVVIAIWCRISMQRRYKIVQTEV